MMRCCAVAWQWKGLDWIHFVYPFMCMIIKYISMCFIHSPKVTDLLWAGEVRLIYFFMQWTMWNVWWSAALQLSANTSLASTGSSMYYDGCIALIKINWIKILEVWVYQNKWFCRLIHHLTFESIWSMEYGMWMPDQIGCDNDDKILCWHEKCDSCQIDMLTAVTLQFYVKTTWYCLSHWKNTNCSALTMHHILFMTKWTRVSLADR